MPLVDAADAPPEEPSARAKERFEESLARNFPQTRILTQQQMRIALLKIIQQTPGDGLATIQRLTSSHLALATPGYGSIYGLLNQLESEGNLKGDWVEEGTRSLKKYTITKSGDEVLQSDWTGEFSLGDAPEST
jgi:DNA-binding PadR family transcriptional regulator